MRIPRTRRAGGAAMGWGRLPLDGVGSCRLFFTDDLHDNLSWVPASEKPNTFKSCFTHSSQVFFGRPGPFLPRTGLDLTLFISPLERMTCVCNYLSVLGLKLNHVSKRGHRYGHAEVIQTTVVVNEKNTNTIEGNQRFVYNHNFWREHPMTSFHKLRCVFTK